MVAFHFPPLSGSSGIQRTLRFVQHLPAHNWQPIVLSVHPRAYERTSDDLMREVPAAVEVCRALALDSARHLSIAGRHFGWTARPDRWVSWRVDGLRQGLRLVRERGAVAVWSTYPIATAHLIAAGVQRRSGLPWIADFRDPMAQDEYPADPRRRAAFKRIEQIAADRAAMCIFSTPGALREYQQRYPHAAERMALLENGYDEMSFVEAERARARQQPLNAGAITLLHSGIVYPQERDPEPLFKAVRALAVASQLDSRPLRIRFRAPVHDALLHRLARLHAVEGLVEVLPPIPYGDALVEMLRADGLLVMQSRGCNAQVPAKLYEYLRAGRPVLCLADPAGDTGQLCLGAGLPDVAALEDCDAIAACLTSFLARLREGAAATARPSVVKAASREARTARLAQWLETIAERRDRPPG